MFVGNGRTSGQWSDFQICFALHAEKRSSETMFGRREQIVEESGGGTGGVQGKERGME
jgi:hypothetical protein